MYRIRYVEASSIKDMESQPLSEINVTTPKLIYKPENKYNLQEALGLKNERKRWLGYLDIMRECLYEKNVDFETDYRNQKNIITSQITRTFKKKAPDFPLTLGDWAIKEMLISTIQNKRYYLKKKKENIRVPPPPAPPESPQLPQTQDPVSPPPAPPQLQDPVPAVPPLELEPNNEDNVNRGIRGEVSKKKRGRPKSINQNIRKTNKKK